MSAFGVWLRLGLTGSALGTLVMPKISAALERSVEYRK